MVPSRRTQQNWLPAFFNDFFDDDFRHFGNMMRTSSPAINVKENDKEYKVEIAAPGMSKDDFKIRINEENELVVTLEHKDEHKEEKKDEKYLRREFSYSHFEQTLLLPDDIKKEEISAIRTSRSAAFCCHSIYIHQNIVILFRDIIKIGNEHK